MRIPEIRKKMQQIVDSIYPAVHEYEALHAVNRLVLLAEKLAETREAEMRGRVEKALKRPTLTGRGKKR